MRTARGYWRLLGASCVAFLLTAAASGIAVHQVAGLTAIWPANAVTLALLLVHGRTRGRRVSIAAGAFLGSLLWSLLRLQSPLQCLLFPISNTLESVLAAAIIRFRGELRGPFLRVRDVLSLIVACVVAPLPSALIGAFANHHRHGTPLREEWLNWYGAALLGLALVTPAVMLMLQPPRAKERATGRDIAETLAILALVAVATLVTFVFAPGRFGGTPILFMVPPCVMLAAFRRRQVGAVLASIIVMLIAAQATVEGIGPIAGCCAAQAQQLNMLQFFLVVTFLTALPVAAAIAERDDRAHEARLIAGHFRTVVENIDKVIFRVDGEGRWTYLNPAWTAVTGHAISASIGRPWHEHADGDADEFLEWARPVLAGEVPASRRLFRLATAERGVRWMEVSFQHLRDGDEHSGATGTMRDVHDRKRMEDQVLAAKREADARARESALLAATDELTGLANRRAFGRHLQRQLEVVADQGRRLTLAIFDVDHFKSVNDEHGHDVGDRVLRRVASRALGVVRSGDVVGRLGGEEFGIIMPGAGLEDARAVAERLRIAIQAPARAGEEALPRVTVSIGIAAAVAEKAAGALTQEADRALYAAKRDGRNQVKIAA